MDTNDTAVIGAQPASAGTDRIERQTVLRAPRRRVWRALTDSTEFGQWFRVRLDGPFVAGGSLAGQILHPGYEHVRFAVADVQMRPEDYFAYRWHPYAVDPAVDYSAEPQTLVEFTLTDTAEGGTLLTLVESGFDRLPAHRRSEALRMNSGGWAAQLENIRRHVDA